MKIVTINLDDELYEELLRRAREEGFLTVAEYLNSLILRMFEEGDTEVIKEESKKHSTMERLLSIIERKVYDAVNPFTQKIDDINRKIALLIERLEALEERLNSLEEKSKSMESVTEETKTPKEIKKAKKTAMDILKEQKVIFERDIATKIRDRDTFFAKLEREGAIVIEAKNERIAVDPQFWQQLMDKLKDIKTNNEEEMKKLLDPVEFKVVQKLRESALLIFDNTTKVWNLVL